METERLMVSSLLRQRCDGVDAPHIAQQIHEYLCEPPTWITLIEAPHLPEHQVLKMAQQIVARGYANTRVNRPSGSEVWILDFMAERGLVSVFFYLVKHAQLTHRGIIAAAKHGHLPILQHMMENSESSHHHAHAAIEAAVKKDHFHMVRYLHDFVPVLKPRRTDDLFFDAPSSMPGSAASTGNLPMLQYLWQVDGQLESASQKYVWNDDVPDNAARQGHLEMLAWLYDCTPLRCSKFASCTATYGYMEIVKLIMDRQEELRSDERFVKGMLVNAAKERHYDLVEYLLGVREDLQVLAPSYRLICAAATGDLALVKHWHTQAALPTVPTATNAAARRGHMDVLHFLYEQGYPPCDKGELYGALAFGDAGVIEFLCEKEPTDESMKAAIELNRVQAVEFLFSLHQTYQSRKSYPRNCINKGRPQMLKCLCDRGLTSLRIFDLMEVPERDGEETFTFVINRLAADGAFDPVDQEEASHSRSCDDDPPQWRQVECVVEWLARRNKLEWIKQLASRYPLHTFDCSAAIDAAAALGRMGVIQFFHAHNYQGFSTNTIDRASEWGHLHIVKYLHLNRNEGFPDNAIDAAAKSGNLLMVKYLHKYGAGATSGAMDKAAKRGFLDIVQFLHEHRMECCTPCAMDEAAANGHLDVVKYLHFHVHAVCTTEAMDRAARLGRLEVVKFLHENRSEGCTAKAIDDAAGFARLEIVKFLYEHRTERFTIDWIMKRCHREPEVYAYFCQVRPDLFAPCESHGERCSYYSDY